MERVLELEEGAASESAGRNVLPIHWFKFNGKRKVSLTTRTNKQVVLEPGFLFSVQEYSKTHDVIGFEHRKVRIKLLIAASEKLMERSKPFKGKVKVDVPMAKTVEEPTVKIEDVPTKGNKIQIKMPKGKVEKHEPKDELPSHKNYRIIDPPEMDEDISEDEVRDLLNSFSSERATLKAPKV
jgi:hypothetical protein